MIRPSQSIPAAAQSWKDSGNGEYASFLDRLSAKDRARMVKHEELSEAIGKKGYGELWKHLVAGLGKLAPYATEIQGSDSARFYIQDGKFKQQVFALVQTKESTAVIFLPDVLDRAIERNLLSRSATPSMYGIPGSKNAEIQLEVITADTRDMPACKPMLGWGRRALRAELQNLDDKDRVRVIEQLCELAAEQWANNVAAAPPPR